MIPKATTGGEDSKWSHRSIGDHRTTKNSCAGSTAVAFRSSSFAVTAATAQTTSWRWRKSVQTGQGGTRQSRVCPAAGGCSFPADPAVSALTAAPLWRPQLFPATVIVTAAPEGFGAPPLPDPLGSSFSVSAANGLHAIMADDHGDHRIWFSARRATRQYRFPHTARRALSVAHPQRATPAPAPRQPALRPMASRAASDPLSVSSSVPHAARLGRRGVGRLAEVEEAAFRAPPFRPPGRRRVLRKQSFGSSLVRCRRHNGAPCLPRKRLDRHALARIRLHEITE